MLLSGLRSKDARSAKWEHLDEERRALFLPEPKCLSENMLNPLNRL